MKIDDADLQFILKESNPSMTFTKPFVACSTPCFSSITPDRSFRQGLAAIVPGLYMWCGVTWAYMALGIRTTWGRREDQSNATDTQKMYWRIVRSEEPETLPTTEKDIERLNLTNITGPDSTKLLGKAPFSESQIAQEDAFLGEPEDEDFTGSGGNSRISAPHYSCQSVNPNSDQKPVVLEFIYLSRVLTKHIEQTMRLTRLV